MDKKFISIIIISLIALSLGSYYMLSSIRRDELICKDCNVIVISLTSTRVKNLPFYNPEKKNAPNLENFFKDAYIFEKAFSPASLTFSDYISLHYSLQPMKHRLTNYDRIQYAKNTLRNYNSLTSILRENGYYSAAFVSDDDYNGAYLLGPQFDYYFDKDYYPDYGIKFENQKYSTGARELIKPTLDWLKNNYKKKFFLLFQSYDNHCPYNPDKEFRDKIKIPHNEKIDFKQCFVTLDEMKKKVVNGKNYYNLLIWKTFKNLKMDGEVWFSDNDLAYLKSLYDAEIENTDHNLAPLLDEIKKLGLDKKSIIIFMAEHGDNLGENGHFMKASIKPISNLQNVNIAFPFVMKLPNKKGQYRQKQIFQSIDFAPTLLELLGLEVDPKMHGKSFLSALGTNKKINKFAYAGTFRTRAVFESGKFFYEAIQDEKWKQSYFKREKLDGSIVEEIFLYDLEKDPEENNNIVGQFKDISDYLTEERIRLRKDYEK